MAIQIKKISACYHPATVLFIDDDLVYLQNLLSQIDAQDVAPKSYNNPKKALEFLTNTYKPNYFTKYSIKQPEESEINQRSIDIDINSIHKMLYNPDRFEQISVVVVDQEMPGLIGLDLCKKLENDPIKKIMLTGEVDNEQAIQALNEGVIDAFISKSAKNFSEPMQSIIHYQQTRFFFELSKSIIDSLIENINYPISSCLNDEVFIKLFNKLCEKKKIVEYYLLDEQGSFLFVDFDGNLSLLVVKDEDAMASTFFNAEVADQMPSENTMHSLKKREKILYLASNDENKIAPADWESQGKLHPAKKLIGNKQTYYYSYITDLKSYNFQSENIVSFKDYLEKLY